MTTVSRNDIEHRGARSMTNSIYRIVMLTCMAVVLGAPSSVRSESAGESLADLRLADQHGNVHAIPSATTTVLFAADMAAKKIVQALLDARDAHYLSHHQAVFIADIHGMPRIITKLFALPRMRKYGYEILLVEDADVGERFPRRAGEVTVLRLRDLRPIAIHYIRDVEALTRVLEGGLASSPLLPGSREANSRRPDLIR
jgi:hypothetical protein